MSSSQIQVYMIRGDDRTRGGSIAARHTGGLERECGTEGGSRRRGGRRAANSEGGRVRGSTAHQHPERTFSTTKSLRSKERSVSPSSDDDSPCPVSRPDGAMASTRREDQ
jgi:hypothetical protein